MLMKFVNMVDRLRLGDTILRGCNSLNAESVYHLYYRMEGIRKPSSSGVPKGGCVVGIF